MWHLFDRFATLVTFHVFRLYYVTLISYKTFFSTEKSKLSFFQTWLAFTNCCLWLYRVGTSKGGWGALSNSKIKKSREIQSHICLNFCALAIYRGNLTCLRLYAKYSIIYHLPRIPLALTTSHLDPIKYTPIHYGSLAGETAKCADRFWRLGTSISTQRGVTGLP